MQLFCSPFFVFLYEFGCTIQFIYPFNPFASNYAQITFIRTCRLFDSIEIGQFRTNRGPNFTGGGVPCQDRKACLRCVFDRWQGQAAGYWGRGAPAGRSHSQPGHGAKTTCPGPGRRTVAQGTVTLRTVLPVQRTVLPVQRNALAEP